MLEVYKYNEQTVKTINRGKMGFRHPPKLFLRSDSNNSQKMLGKTAHYDPQEKAITLFTHNRHPKDILRSYAHELVHHTQNLRGDLSPEKCGEMGDGYAQANGHMREMEREAYEKGNMCFRDWEDTLSDKDTYIIIKIAESKNLKENKSMTTKITKEFLKETINKILETQLAKPSKLPPKKRTGVSSGERGEVEVKSVEDAEDNLEENEMFAPSHYCVHHGGVQHEGKVVAAEAVNHNYNEELGKVTHYDMKLEDGTILENVATEEIQVTNASLMNEHDDHTAKRNSNACPDCKGEGCSKCKPVTSEENEELEEAGRFDNNDGVDQRCDHVDCNESKIQTPEQENSLYESRFTPRNNRLFENLTKKWTK